MQCCGGIHYGVTLRVLAPACDVGAEIAIATGAAIVGVTIVIPCGGLIGWDRFDDAAANTS